VPIASVAPLSGGGCAAGAPLGAPPLTGLSAFSPDTCALPRDSRCLG
jgi:hypothetical protein